jgi:DNA-binding GntR family transcriptional regulator
MAACGHTGLKRAMAKKRTGPRKALTLKKILRPLAGDSHRRASIDIHQYLRDLILSNALPPETILSQVEVAECLKVSRTPVREALRMLMEEGLVIANEGIAATVTVQSMTDKDIEKLAELLRQLHKDEKQHNLRRWLKNHRAFHQMLFCGANPLLQKRMTVDNQRSERYVYNAAQAGLTAIFRRAAIEHKKIYQACKRRQPAVVVTLLTEHLAAAATDIMAEFAPNWEPTTLRNAARLMHSGAAHLDDA